MKTPSRVTARFGLAGGLNATARGFREEPRFATVLSGCDAEFALRVDPFCPSLSYVGQATARKRSPAQPYILTIVGDARSIAAAQLRTRVNCCLRRVVQATQCFQRSPHKFLNMLVTFRIAEFRGACCAIAFASFFLAAKLGKKIAAG